MANPAFQYDFDSLFGQTIPWWNGSVNMFQFISTIVGALLSIMCYIFLAVALYTIAKRQGVKPAGLAWVPILNFYLLGKIADVIGKAEGRKTHRRITLLVLYLVLGAFSIGLLAYLPAFLDFLFQFMIYYNYYQPFLSGNPDVFTPLVLPAWFTALSGVLIVTLSILYFVFLMRAVYIIIKDRSPRNCALMIVLCIFFSFAIGPCLFAVRNKPSMAEARLNYEKRQQQEAAEAMARFQRERAQAQAATQATDQQAVSPVSDGEATDTTIIE